MNKRDEVLLIFALIVISAVPRLTGLSRFTSVDEPFWLRQGANFYYALGQREFENTIYEYHPAVTTMWIVASGMLVYFPEYRLLGQGYLKPGKFDLFLPLHGKDPLQLLTISRAIQVLVIVVVLLATYTLLRLLFDRRDSFFATALISCSPFLLGHSRLLNHEAMLALFIMISMLSMLAYLHRAQKPVLLLVSSIAGALAQLSKSSGILLFPLIVLILLINILVEHQRKLVHRIIQGAKTGTLWFLVLVVGYVLFWPGMWVAPAKMLYEVYGNALSYTFQGARLSVLPGLNAGGFGLDTLLSGLRFYVGDLFWRTTPISWFGLVVGIGFAVTYFRSKTELNYQLVALYSILLAAAFLLMFSLQRGPKPPHYTLTSYASIDLIAGLGLSRAWQALAYRYRGLASRFSEWLVLGSFLTIQLSSSAIAYPYFISYYNPLMEALQPGTQNPTLDVTGYGVGLDQAASYLSRKVDAPKLTVMSANGYGCFSYYFPGRTVPMNNLILSDPELVKILRGSQYAVVDYYNQKKNGLLGEIDKVKPETSIWINGIDFLHIYRASDLLAQIDRIQP